MRLDKFLKLSRLVKRRTVAAELCDLGAVQVNGKVAKAAHTVKVGDTLCLRFGSRLVQARILALPTRALGNQAEMAAYVEMVTLSEQER